jgi:hypothetical protein
MLDCSAARAGRQRRGHARTAKRVREHGVVAAVMGEAPARNHDTMAGHGSRWDSAGAR